jgi:hypothetical protein
MSREAFIIGGRMVFASIRDQTVSEIGNKL